MTLSLSPILRELEPGLVMFWCPGCNEPHAVKIAGPAAWGYNGNPDAPTFTPSVKVMWPANPDAIAGFEMWRAERVCHSYVTDGQIQFLSDCTHPLAGQTVPLPDFQISEEGD